MELKKFFKGFKPKKSAVLMLALLALQGSAGILGASADTVAENVNVSSDYVKVSTSTGVHDVGKITVRTNGKEELAFCIEPDVIIPLGDNSGYIGKDRIDISARTEQIATLWNTVSDDIWYYRVAQTMIWEQVNGIQIYSIDGLSDTDYQNIKAQINQAVDNYNKKPSFNGQTVTVKLGDTVKITDTNNSNLSQFDNMRLNSANVNYSVNGNDLSITPTKDSNVDGSIRFAKTVAVGTSVVYQKSGSQTLMVAKITDPAFYSVNLKVIKTGKSQVQKLDAETGKPMAGVKFKMTADGKDYDVTTNSKGIGLVDKEFLNDTEVTYTEVKTLDGYVLNTTPIKGKIKAGETITLSMNNETQKGRVKGHKEKEVYNASES
ncbi:MAG: SpaA isopeptide-forming pilin-related protein, partial [Leuconostoc mesenteroides]